MADRFIAFWDTGESVRTTVVAVGLDELLDRLRTRLVEIEPGTLVRIDVIAEEA